jgi:hypothetical protein
MRFTGVSFAVIALLSVVMVIDADSARGLPYAVLGASFSIASAIIISLARDK